jgi:hypothetical protein
MQSGSVDFVSTVLPVTTHSYTEQIPTDYKTNTTASSSSSSGYESVLSRTSKSHQSFFSRLKRLINFPSTKKSSDYQISTINNFNEQNSNQSNSPMISFKNPMSSSGLTNNIINSNENRRNSLTRLDIRRKSARRTLASATQHIPFLYGLKNCGNTW